MKLRLLVKMVMVLTLLFVGFHLVSMPHFSHTISHGKVIAVETEGSVATGHVTEEDQKQIDLYNCIQVKESLILLVVTSLSIYSSIKTSRRLRHFLYSVYYQSSYFSKNHLFTT